MESDGGYGRFRRDGLGVIATRRWSALARCGVLSEPVVRIAGSSLPMAPERGDWWQMSRHLGLGTDPLDENERMRLRERDVG
jgi:hypothetical protein